MTITLGWWAVPAALCVVAVLLFLWAGTYGGTDGCGPMIISGVLFVLAVGIIVGKLVFGGGT